MRKIITIIALLVLTLFIVSCGSEKSADSLQIEEGQETGSSDPAQTAPQETNQVVPSGEQPATTVTAPTPSSTPASTVSEPASTQKPAETASKTKTQEILDKMYVKLEKGAKYQNKGDVIYLKNKGSERKMAIEFAQMYTLPGTRDPQFPRASQIDLAFFDLNTGKGRGYCLGRVQGAEFSCNDLQDKALDIKFKDFEEFYALFYLEQFKDVDPDSYTSNAERVNGVQTSRLNYGGEEGVTIWISTFDGMPIKVSMRRQDPYTKEIHYSDYSFGVDDVKLNDPFK